MHDFIVNFPVRLVTHGEIQPSLLVYDAFAVGKGGKTVFAVVGAHAACAETTESHFAGGEMNNGVVDAASAKTASGSNFFYRLFVGGKEVKCERARHGVDRSDGVVQGGVGQDRKHRAENLLLHGGILEGNGVQYGRFDAESFMIRISPMDGFFLIHQV